MIGLNLIFSRSHAPVSLAIQALTFSRWSHVGILNGSSVIEATSPKVREVSLDKFMADKSALEVAKIYCGEPATAIRAAQSQIGRPYDWSALWGILSGRDWQAPDKWFCSELVAWSLAQAGSPIVRLEGQSRVTPGDLWLMSERLENGSL